MKIFVSLIIFLFIEFFESGRSEEAGSWAKPCKLRESGDDLIPESLECDGSKGFTCERYSQGAYCGCHIRSPYTYDKQSKECRKGLGQFCNPMDPEDPDEYVNRPFSKKCHHRAECVLQKGSDGKKDYNICLCRPEFIFKDAECVSPNKSMPVSAASLLSISIFSIAASIIMLCSTCKRINEST